MLAITNAVVICSPLSCVHLDIALAWLVSVTPLYLDRAWELRIQITPTAVLGSSFKSIYLF